MTAAVTARYGQQWPDPRKPPIERTRKQQLNRQPTEQDLVSVTLLRPAAMCYDAGLSAPPASGGLDRTKSVWEVFLINDFKGWRQSCVQTL